MGIFNQKGGVGKTTVAAIVAEFFALVKGKRVLVIDSDMQCNTSDYWVGMEPSPNVVGGQLPPVHPEYEGESDCNERSTIADIFWGKSVMPYGTYLDGKAHGNGLVEVMLGHPKLLETVNNEFDAKSGEIETMVTNQLGKFLHDESIKEEYDVVVIDTGPSRNPVFRAAIRASTHALIPFEPETKSLQGINAMLQAVTAENYARTEDTVPLKLLGLLPNKVRRTNLHKKAMSQIRGLKGGDLVPDDVYLPMAIAFPQRDVKGADPKSVFHLPESTTARIQSERVGEFVFRQVFSDEVQGETNNVHAIGQGRDV